MPKTFNGRPANLGSMYFDKKDGSMKYCTGYCDGCGTKMGLSNEDLKEMAHHLPSHKTMFLARLLKARIIVPG